MRIRKQRLPHDDYLYINGLSAITSIMARDGLANFDDAMETYKKEVYAFHRFRSRRTNETLNQYARNKALQKARRYNSLRKKQFKQGRT